METKNISIIEPGILTKAQRSKESYYVNFTDDDVDELTHYAFDMGYMLEPESNAGDQEHPGKIKVISKNNPAVYGWISKVIEQVNDELQEKFIYGFYRGPRYFNKYPITFNINSHQMRGMMKRNAVKNPRQTNYFRTVFGILDLEPEINPLEFIFSWLWSVKIKHV